MWLQFCHLNLTITLIVKLGLWGGLKTKLLLGFDIWVFTPTSQYLFLQIKNYQPCAWNKILAIKTYKQNDMEYLSNFDKLLMWTCTNEQLVSYTWYRASYLIAYSIPSHTYIPTYFSCLLETKDVSWLAS